LRSHCLLLNCLFISTWFNFGRSFVSRSWCISSIFSNLLEYKFSKYFLMMVWISLVSVVMSHFSSLILSTWFFSLLVSLTKGLSILFMFSKTSLFCWFFYHSFSFHFINICLYLSYFYWFRDWLIFLISLIASLTYLRSHWFFFNVDTPIYKHPLLQALWLYPIGSGVYI
jgi:hypothetical protein